MKGIGRIKIPPATIEVRYEVSPGSERFIRWPMPTQMCVTVGDGPTKRVYWGKVPKEHQAMSAGALQSSERRFVAAQLTSDGIAAALAPLLGGRHVVGTGTVEVTSNPLALHAATCMSVEERNRIHMNSNHRKTAKNTKARRPATTSRRFGGVAKGQRRSPAAIRAVADKFLAYVKKSPGEGIEAIGRGLGLPTSELVLPVKMLRAEKRLKVKGEKRATRYSARAS